jgi:hypothetical protein
MEDDTERGRTMAGRVYMQCQVAGWLSVVGAVICGVAQLEFQADRTLALAAGVMLVAAALAFGLLANAVLRR